ncbi:hypothetical protein jhhlp_005959 [Lomentospora prolificans]|uniref:G domain-containing protein n=1 Tax=Lomentospora prolificans TaxID=41688 RepID=A0A2N3N4J8_9PEZI|nr:hypothetical protein jhhlp_005959 [Lomentospora prolificans]
MRALAPLVDKDGFNSDGEKEIVLAVMGVTGAGKSYFIKQLTGQDVELGHGLEACTQTVQSIRMRYQNMNVTILDSPGFNDTYRTDTDVLLDITSYLSTVYTQGFKLSGIIYLHSISHKKMEGSSRMSLLMFRKLVGDAALGNVILATTQWADVPEADGAKREDELMAKFWKPLVDEGARSVRYKGDHDSAVEIMKMVLAEPRVVLDIQRELVDERKPLLETAAGYTLNEQLVEMQQKYERQLNLVKEEMASKDEAHEELSQIVKQLEDQLASVRAQHTKMKDRETAAARESLRVQDQIRKFTRPFRRRRETSRRGLADEVEHGDSSLLR